MALSKRPDGNNYYYDFYYYDEAGKRRRKSVNTGISSKKDSQRAKDKAIENGLKKKEEFLKELKVKMDRRIENHTIGLRKDYTLAQYGDFWLNEIADNIKANTAESYQRTLVNHIYPFLGHIRICDLNQLDIKDYLKAQIDDCKQRQATIVLKEAKNKKVKSNERTYFTSIKKHLTILSMLLDYAVGEMDITENPVKLVNKQVLKQIPESTFVAEPYNLEEVAKLREVIKGHHLESAIILASYLGLRREEVLGLRWSDIDLSNRRVTIQHVCVLVKSQPVYRDTPKSKASKASLAVITPLRDYLLKLKLQQAKDKDFFGSSYYDSDYVCRWPDGHPIKPNNVSQGYKRLLQKAGLRHTRFHDLRHTVGEVILEDTGNIKLVSDTLRHSSIGITADIYTRSSDKSIAKGLEALDTSNMDTNEESSDANDSYNDESQSN